MAEPVAQTPQPINPKSKLVVAGMILLILVGTAAWNAWDLLGTEGIDPKRVKEMAKTYEKVCISHTQDVKTCKRHIGRYHRECLPTGLDRPEHQPKAAPRYNDAAYQQCMESKRSATPAATPPVP